MPTPFYQDHHVTLYNADCFRMGDLPDASVQCCVTSPPYWGLRKYKAPDLIFGGSAGCVHEWGDEMIAPNSGGGWNDPEKRSQYPPFRLKAPAKERQTNVSQGCFCQICGAWRGQYGLEPTVQMYVDNSLEILREIRRVLRSDGVVFWNVGDSYASGKGTCYNPGGGFNSLSGHTALKEGEAYPLNRGNKTTLTAQGLKPKDLALIPARIALAAQADGWWVRSDIIWNKPNPMPESVTDRPADCHEHIIMLTKSARYYYDAEAVKEPVADSTVKRGPVAFGGDKGRSFEPGPDDPNFRNGSSQWGRTFDYEKCSATGRNLRNVWTFPTQPYPGAHFATFPEELPERCIKAATPEAGSCSKCGKPWHRVIEKTEMPHDVDAAGKGGEGAHDNTTRLHQMRDAARARGSEVFTSTVTTLGWEASCKCGAPAVPATVLEPFAGSGTTLWIAKRLNRRSVGFEISPEYCRLIEERNRQQVAL